MRTKHLLLGALSALLLTTSAAAFTDVDGHWAEDTIAKWSQDYQIIQGYEDGTFQPDNSITRGAFAGVMNRFLSYQTAAPATTFTDISGSFWAKDILKLNAAGVMLGDQGCAMPDATITRQEALVMMARAFRVEAGEETTLSYDDADQVSSYAQATLATMTALGYVTDSDDGNFRPRDPITRAEVLTFLSNMVDTVIQESAVFQEDTKGSLVINSGDVVVQFCTIQGDVILTPNASYAVMLKNVTIEGNLINLGGAAPYITTVDVTPEDDKNDTEKEEDEDKFQPTPGESQGTNGEFLTYSGKEYAVWNGVAQSTLSDADFAWGEPGKQRLTYQGDDAVKSRFGIDVSAHQNRNQPNKSINWEAVAADGVDFAFIRVAGRGTTAGALYVDDYYEENLDGAMAAGIDTGAYIFSQAISVEEAIEEAELVLELLDGRPLTGPIAYDWEMKDSSYRVFGIDPDVATAAAVAFCQRIEEAGYEAAVYFSTYVGYVKYDLSQMTDWSFWHPAYKYESSETKSPSFFYQMDYWQYTDSAVIDGILGRVDGNIQFIWD